jgi:hypothetical protein
LNWFKALVAAGRNELVAFKQIENDLESAELVVTEKI